MSQQDEGYIYRRIPSHLHSRGVIAPDAFIISSKMKGLSVYDASKITPYQVLEARLEEARKQADSPDATLRQKGEKTLKNSPDVKTLVEVTKWRVAQIPVAGVKALGFTKWEKPDPNGHLNILGSETDFEDKKADFIELFMSNKARLLTEAECLDKNYTPK